MVKIKNEDELCCARAIVTVKALADANGDTKDRDYKNLKQGCPIQEKKAKKLHLDAGVPEGPCGLTELEAFQRHLTDYQIVVLSVDHNYQIIFKGPPQDKQIILIKVGEHYHGCNSLPGFLGSIYFCVECEKSFNTNDISHHPCKGKKCRACCQTQCRDYLQSDGQEARHTCPRCHRQFFGEQCLGNHYVYSTTDGKRADSAKKIKPVCATVRQCPVCNKLLRPHEIETRHVCGTSECPSCKQYHDLTKHQCYIQNPTRLEERRKLLRSRKRKADGSRSLEEKDSLFVYWDSETMQDTGVHVPNMVCAATSNCNDLFPFEFPTCIEAFLDWLRELAQDFKLTVLAHNSQGFDS